MLKKRHSNTRARRNRALSSPAAVKFRAGRSAHTLGRLSSSALVPTQVKHLLLLLELPRTPGLPQRRALHTASRNHYRPSQWATSSLYMETLPLKQPRRRTPSQPTVRPLRPISHRIPPTQSKEPLR